MLRAHARRRQVCLDQDMVAHHGCAQRTEEPLYIEVGGVCAHHEVPKPPLLQGGKPGRKKNPIRLVFNGYRDGEAIGGYPLRVASVSQR